MYPVQDELAEIEGRYADRDDDPARRPAGAGTRIVDRCYPPAGGNDPR